MKTSGGNYRGARTGLFRFHSLRRKRRGRGGVFSTCKNCIDACMSCNYDRW